MEMQNDPTAYIVSLQKTNALWIWNQLHLAETEEQLEQVAIDIGNDKFENEPYTKDDVAMRIIRAAYKRQLKRIKEPDRRE